MSVTISFYQEVTAITIFPEISTIFLCMDAELLWNFQTWKCNDDLFKNNMFTEIFLHHRAGTSLYLAAMIPFIKFWKEAAL